jgi:hypothetical protein
MEYLTTPYHETDLGDITTTKPEQDLILPVIYNTKKFIVKQLLK